MTQSPARPAVAGSSAADADEVPAVVVDVELTEAVPAVPARDAAGRRVRQARLLVRLQGEPLDLVAVPVPDEGLSAEAVLAASVPPVRVALSERLAEVGLDVADLGVTGCAVPATAFVRGREEVLAARVPVTVVICTRERPDGLRLVLESLVGQVHEPVRVLVVDNAPATSASREVVDSFAGRLDVQYVVEPRPGLSRARNRALRVLAVDRPGDEIVAWLDDDEQADRWWAVEVARAFAGDPGVVAMSGVVVPAELATRAQMWFEQFGGHSKGRGFTPDRFSPETERRQSPLYPLPPFGVGANMAFRLSELVAIGGFDEALGAGTPARGSEDTLVFTQVLLRGGAVRYWPAALTRHHHRRDLAGLTTQMRGYGSGLTGYYTALVLSDPRVLIGLARLAPRALKDLFGSDSPRVATLEDDFPTDLLGLNRRGMLAGPGLYLSGRRAARRAVRSDRTNGSGSR